MTHSYLGARLTPFLQQIVSDDGKSDFREDIGTILNCAREGKAEELREALLDFRDKFRAALEKQEKELVRQVTDTVMSGLDAACREAGEAGARGGEKTGDVKKAVALMSDKIDSLPRSDQPIYHYIGHFVDVAIVALAMGIYDNNKGYGISKEGVEDLFLAGLLHDIFHPGGINGEIEGKYQYFRIENISWNYAQEILIESGFNEQRLEKIHLLLMATEPRLGPALVDLALRYHQAEMEAERSVIVREKDEFISRNEHEDVRFLAGNLFINPELARQADYLTKADIAFSLLSPKTYYANTLDFHEENIAAQTGLSFIGKDGYPIEGAAKFFFENIAGVNGKPFQQKTVREIFGNVPLNTKEIVLSGKLGNYVELRPKTNVREAVRGNVKQQPPRAFKAAPR